MVQVNSNPLEVISTLVFLAFLLSVGLVFGVRPQVGVRLTAQWLQSYQRFYKLSDEQLERTPRLFFRSIAGDSITEFARNGTQHPELYPKAMLMMRIAGLVILGFLLIPACFVLLLILVSDVTFVSSARQQPPTLEGMSLVMALVIRGYDSNKLARPVQQPFETMSRSSRVLLPLRTMARNDRWSFRTGRLPMNIGWRSLLAVLCVSIAIVVSSCGMPKDISVADAQNAAEELVDAYMRSMAEKNVMLAYALLSTRLQQVYSLSDVEGLLQGNSYGLYEAYESTEVEKVIVTTRFSTNPAVPRTMAQVTGTVNYQGGVQGTIEANMELEDGQWRLSKVWIVVPPEKLQGSPEAMQPTTCSTTIPRPCSGQA